MSVFGARKICRDGRMVDVQGRRVETVAMNIKNPETEQLARELARKTGESLTTAITIALKERLERQRERPRKKSRIEALAEFSEKCAPLFQDGRSAQELIEDLYDKETGLPK
jgi:antitoxin VapB